MSDPIYDPSLLPEEMADAPGQERPGAGLFDWLQTAMACILCAVLVFTCFARLSRVDGDSMHPTLLDGELTLVRTMGYRPQAGDIVVLNKTTARLGSWDSPQAIVKRVIATGGQVVDIDYGTGTVYVDGVALDEPYLAEEMYQPYSPTWPSPTGRCPRTMCSSWGTTATPPPTAGTTGWARCTRISCWASWCWPFGPLTASAAWTDARFRQTPRPKMGRGVLFCPDFPGICCIGPLFGVK